MYKIVRVYKDSQIKRTIATHLTKQEAQAHCNDPETSSATCKLACNKRRTKQYGPWFDTYDEE